MAEKKKPVRNRIVGATLWEVRVLDPDGGRWDDLLFIGGSMASAETRAKKVMWSRLGRSHGYSIESVKNGGTIDG